MHRNARTGGVLVVQPRRGPRRGPRCQVRRWPRRPARCARAPRWFELLPGCGLRDRPQVRHSVLRDGRGVYLRRVRVRDQASVHEWQHVRVADRKAQWLWSHLLRRDDVVSPGRWRIGRASSSRRSASERVGSHGVESAAMRDRDAALPALPREVERSVLRVARKNGKLKAVLRHAERELVAEALRDQHGNKTRAAAALGIERTLFHKKLASLGVPTAPGLRAAKGARLPLAREIANTVLSIARNKGTLTQMVRGVERWFVADALRAHGGSRAKAAAALGITREAVDKKLRKLELRRAPRQTKAGGQRLAQQTPTLRETLRQVRRWLVARTLRAQPNKTRAAAALGIDRVGLYVQMRKLGIRPADFPRAISERTTRRRTRR